MDYSLLRSRARENLKGLWPLSIGVAALSVLLGGPGNFFFPDLEIITESVLFEYGEFRIALTQGILCMVGFVLGGVIELGWCRFFLKQHDRQNPEFNDLFAEFHRYGTGFAQSFLRGLYCFLWALLFIVPGIVKSYAYAMTPYILIDHPEMTASEAIRRSQLMMDGHKGELFVLELTFIGWNILAGLAFNLGYLAVNPYKGGATAAFYRQLLAQEHREGVTYTTEP